MSDRTPKIVLRSLRGSAPPRPAADDGRRKCKVGRQDRRPMLVSLAVLTIHLSWGAGCAVSSATMYPIGAPGRAAVDPPERFMVNAIDTPGVLTEPQRDGGCRNPVIDPRDGTRLRLVQSVRHGEEQIGDYEPPAGRYGVRAEELLRLDCGTGKVIGVVPAHG